uniref:Induction peptide CbaX n=1 Tax=Carnobacterium maltaromaticum TaxID=2751 RepID=Q9REY6_CARML|nr:induction peptide CbaX [Carnobacterium maltaromaticum]
MKIKTITRKQLIQIKGGSINSQIGKATSSISKCVFSFFKKC